MIKSILKKLGFIKKKSLSAKVKIMKPVYFGLCAPKVTIKEFKVSTFSELSIVELYLNNLEKSGCKVKVMEKHGELDSFFE